jgi:hypothetical protein
VLDACSLCIGREKFEKRQKSQFEEVQIKKLILKKFFKNYWGGKKILKLSRNRPATARAADKSRHASGRHCVMAVQVGVTTTPANRDLQKLHFSISSCLMRKVEASGKIFPRLKQTRREESVSIRGCAHSNRST